MKRKGSGPDAPKSVPLRSLRPQYVEAEHGLYVSLLSRDVLGDLPSRNIAVSGAYGSGKSSVLGGLLAELNAEKVPTIQVSLATLNQSRDALLEVAGESTLTAALEKEVVKRLLYSAEPSKIPRSRFSRIGGFRPWPAAGISAVLSVFVTGAAETFGVSLPLDQLATARDWWAWTGPVLDLTSVGLLAFAAQAAFSSFRLSQIAVGPATLSLDDRNGNYFDHFLDEIIYFFQQTKLRVVLFEDLDRFNDPGIFLALRELNNLLNSSEQVDQSVTFVYAIRDSLFVQTVETDGEPDGALPDSHARAGSDSAASDRAKFFDLIVPIVPFISHEVAADLLIAALDDLPQTIAPSRGLVTLAGRHFTDMRVILSIRNEYAVFASELLAKSAVEGLSPDQMFAIVLYKHLHLDDFERIRTGQSSLDTAIDRIRFGVASSVTKLDEEIARVENAIEASSAVERRAAAAGSRLLARLDSSLEMFGWGRVQSITVRGASMAARDAVCRPDFWNDLAASVEKAITVHSASGQREVSGEALDNLLGPDRDPTGWMRTELDRDQEQLDQLRSARSWLRTASIAELVGGPYPTAPPDSVPDWSFFDRECRDLFDDSLTFELIRHGYLDQNFALYTTKFHGAILTADARSFMMHQVDRHRSDPLFKLSSDDAHELITRLGDALLNDESALNVALVDYLLSTDSPALPLLLETSGQASDFVSTYLANGQCGDDLLDRLTPLRADMLDVISTSESLSLVDRCESVSRCLAALAPGVNYSVSAGTAEFLAAHLDSLPLLSETLDPGVCSVVRDLLAKHDLKVADLSRVAEPLRSHLIQGGRFQITRPNLVNVTANEAAIGLDTIGGLSDGVGLHLLSSSFHEYLTAINGEPVASIVDRSENLDAVVRAVVEQAPSYLGPALSAVRGGVKYEDIGQAPEIVYSDLAGAGLFRLTRRNVSGYIAAIGEIDLPLAVQLDRARAIAVVEVNEYDPEEEAARHHLAAAVAMCSHLSSDAKLDLIESLKTQTTMDVGGLELSDPVLAVGLLVAGEIADGAETFEELLPGPWNVFEAVAAASSAFGEVAGQLPFSEHSLAEMLSSSQIPDLAKRAVLDAFDTFQATQGPSSSSAWLAAAEEFDVVLTSPQVTVLAQAGASPGLVLSCIYRQRARLSVTEVVALLAFSPSPYSSLATPNGAALTLAGSDDLRGLLTVLKAAGIVKEFRKKSLQEQFDVRMAG